jgi:hypothetical protein
MGSEDVLRSKGETMTVLRANLRLFWERWSFWTLYAGILCMVAFPVVLEWVQYYYTGKLSVDFLFPVLATGVLPIGLIVGVMQVETLSCPFALTLPGHQRVVRQVVFVVGLVVSLGVTLIVLPDISLPGSLVLRLWATFSASLVIYLVGVGFTYVIPLQALTVIVMFAWFLFVSGSGWSVYEASPQIILGFPIPVIVVGFLSAAVAWLCLGRPAWGLQAGVAWREWLARQWRRDRVREGTHRDSASHPFLLSLVQTSRGPSAGTYLCGTLYAWLVPGGEGRRQLVLTLAAALACAGLARCFPSIGPLFVMVVPFSFRTPPLYSKLLVGGGRRERFLTTFMLLIIVGVVWTTSVALSFAAMDLMQAYLPQIAAKAADPNQSSSPENIRLAVFLTAFYPLLAFVDLAFRGQPIRQTVASMVVLLFLYSPVIFTKHWLMGIPLVCVPLGITVSWFVCAYGLYRITTRRDLVWARPDEWIGRGW